MGMMINRRRAYGGKKEDTYIQDGLVFWLDGINKGNDPTAWTDLVGGIKFVWNNSVVVQNDHIDTTSITQSLVGDKSALFPTNSSTIEVVVSMPNNTNGIVFMGVANGNICFGMWDNTLGLTTAPIVFHAQFYIFENNKIYSFSCSKSLVSQNKTNLSIVNSSYWSNADSNLYVGGRANNQLLFKGNIYCIRIYNRQLTEADVAYNYDIDRKRFNF